MFVFAVLALIAATMFSTYNFVFKPEAPYLANGRATLWTPETEQLADKICEGCETDEEKVQTFHDYQASQEAVLRSRTLFQNIYRELNKESKNFSPGLIEEKSKTRDFATSIQWLTMTHVVNQSFQLKEHITTPLMPDSESNFRLFLGDIGMFSYKHSSKGYERGFLSHT